MQVEIAVTTAPLSNETMLQQNFAQTISIIDDMIEDYFLQFLELYLLSCSNHGFL
jgi:hypothetical protein